MLRQRRIRNEPYSIIKEITYLKQPKLILTWSKFNSYSR
jgi:hypothetical protein